MLASHPLERRHGPGRLCDRLGKKHVRLVESTAEAGLLALFKDRTDATRGDLSYQELYRVCADIDDRLPRGCHRTILTGIRWRAQEKTLCRKKSVIQSASCA